MPSKNPHGPYATGGFKGKGKAYKGDHAKKGCAVTALALAGGILGSLTAAGYGIVQIFN